MIDGMMGFGWKSCRLDYCLQSTFKNHVWPFTLQVCQPL